MKKIFAVLALTLSVYSFASAQGGGGQRGERFKEMMKQRLKDSLQLSDPKADSVIAVLQEFQPKQREIFMDQSMSQDDKMNKIKELNTERKEKLKTVLTDDQIAKYEAMEQNMRDKMRQGGGRRNGGGNS